MTRRIELRLACSPELFRCALAAAILGIFPLELGSETLVLTTTYPSPSGIYNNLVTTGNGSGSPRTTLNRDAGNTWLVPSTNGSGAVGIGLAADPDVGYKLHIVGKAKLVAPAPTDNDDIVTKGYVDAAAGGPSGWTCNIRQSLVTVGTAVIDCTGSEKVVSGGCAAGGGGYYSYPSGSAVGRQGWSCIHTGGLPIAAYANCCE